MKHLYSLLLLLLALPQLSPGQPQLYIDSTRFMSGISVGPGGDGIQYSIPTADKGILFVGDVSNNPGGIVPYSPYGGDNVMVGKIDSNQKISWIKVYGGNDDDAGQSACQTPDGGYAVLAGTGSHDGDVTGYKGLSDTWLVRLDASGNLLWQKCFGCYYQVLPLSVANTPDHGFIILGSTDGPGYDVPGHYGPAYSWDWVVFKTDSMGNVQWARDMGTSGDEGQEGTILAADSAYYLVSAALTLDHDCTDSAWHRGANTGYDMYILKLDANGTVLWDSSYGGSHDEDAIAAFFDTRDSTIAVVGWTYSGDYMVTGYQGGGDMWVLKVGKNGALIWQKALGGPSQEGGTGICAGPNGGYMVYGITFPGPMGGGDCWMFALDTFGNELSNKIFGGTGPEQHIGSVLPYLNGYVATGTSGSDTFTEGTCNINKSGAFVSYITYGTKPNGITNVNSFAGQNINISPNPTTGKVNIAITGNETGNLLVYNSIGQILYHQRAQQGRTLDMDIGDWPVGMYIVKWRGEDGKLLTAKLIKN